MESSNEMSTKAVAITTKDSHAQTSNTSIKSLLLQIVEKKKYDAIYGIIFDRNTWIILFI